MQLPLVIAMVATAQCSQKVDSYGFVADRFIFCIRLHGNKNEHHSAARVNLPHIYPVVEPTLAQARRSNLLMFPADSGKVI